MDDDGARGDGRGDAGENAERKLSTMIDSRSCAAVGRISLKKEPAVPKWCADENRHRRTTAMLLATSVAPAQTRATTPAARDGESVGGRKVRSAVVVPSTTAAWRCFPNRWGLGGWEGNEGEDGMSCSCNSMKSPVRHTVTPIPEP